MTASERRGVGGGRVRAGAVAGAAALLAVALAACAPALRDDGRSLYQWTDAGGSVHYTAHPGRIPPVRRLSMQRVEAGHRPEPAPAAEAAPATPPAAPAGAAADATRSSPDPFNAEAQHAAPAEPSPELRALDARIANLQVAIERDQEELKGLIADSASAPELRSSPELAAIAKRLPELQAELERLQAQRAGLAGGGPREP
jgi:hypothetical protein